MMIAIQLAAHRQNFTIERLGPGPLLLGLQQRSQIVEAGGQVGMGLGAQEPSAHRQALPQVRLGGGEITPP